jgi:hypothetical protein
VSGNFGDKLNEDYPFGIILEPISCLPRMLNEEKEKIVISARSNRGCQTKRKESQINEENIWESC